MKISAILEDPARRKFLKGLYGFSLLADEFCQQLSFLFTRPSRLNVLHMDGIHLDPHHEHHWDLD
jgi:hypothetical protein